MLKRENVRCIECGMLQENAYLVCPEGREDAFIVDPGDDVNALLKAVRDSGRRLTGILLTHGHFDHILGAQPLAESTGATVYIHADDAEMLDDPDLSAYNPQCSRLAPPLGLKREHYDETLRICGLTLQVLSTPGHSRGSVCLLEPEGKIMFTGDTLFCAGYGRTDLHGGSDHEMIRSLRALLAMDGETAVYSGHGPATTIANERRRYGL